MSIDKRSFGERLTGLRNSQGFSQSELAARLGVTNRAVSKWETGAALPNLDTLDDLATLLGMSLSALMAETQSAGNAAAMIGLVGDEHEMYVATGVICDFYERLGWLVVRTSELGAPALAAFSSYDGRDLPHTAGSAAHGLHGFGSALSRCFAVQLAIEEIALKLAHEKAREGTPALVIAENALPRYEALLGSDSFERLALTSDLSAAEVKNRYAGIIECENKMSSSEILAKASMALGAGHMADAARNDTHVRSFLVKKPRIESLRARTNFVLDSESIVFLQSPQKSKRGVVKRVRAERPRYYSFRIAEDNPHHLLEEEITAHEYQSLLAYKDATLSEVERATANVASGKMLLAIRYYDCYPYSAILDVSLPNTQSNPTLPGYLSLVREISTASAFTPLRIAFDLAHGRL